MKTYTYEICTTNNVDHLNGHIIIIDNEDPNENNDKTGHATVIIKEIRNGIYNNFGTSIPIRYYSNNNQWEGDHYRDDNDKTIQSWLFKFNSDRSTGDFENERQSYIDDYIYYTLDDGNQGEGNGTGTGGNNTVTNLES